MKKYIYILFLLIFTFAAHASSTPIKFNKIEMEIFRNGEVIGFSNYKFTHNNKSTEVHNITKFEVKLLGIKIFSIFSESLEKYKNNILISFESKTFQNNKKKYVNLKHNKFKKVFVIDGSSFKGEAESDNVIGSWWNPKILKAKSQISPLSGSIKEQVVEYFGIESDVNVLKIDE